MSRHRQMGNGVSYPYRYRTAAAGRGFPFGPEQLLALDYTAPTRSTDPAPGAGNSVGPGSATYIWLMEDSGDQTDLVSSAVLTATNSPQTQRNAVGIWDGTDMYSRLCVEGTEGGTARFDGADNDFMDIGTQSFAFMFDFRYTEPWTTNHDLVDKRAATGWRVRSGSNGRYGLTLDDGPDAVAANLGSGIYDDGAWHRVLMVRDTNAGTIATYAEDGNSTSVDGTSIGDISMAELFTLNLDESVQIRNVVFIDGTDAEGLGQADLDATWNHAQDPGTGGIFPQLDTYTRATLACPVVGNESGFGDRVAKYGSGQFAHGWNTNFSHASKLGLLIEEAATNICLDSEGLEAGSAWGVVSTTRTANSAEAPDGTQTSTKLKADSANALTKQAITTVAETEYTQSIFIKRSAAMGGNVSGRLIQYDATGAAENAAVAFTATDEWTRIQLTATTAAGQISTEFQIEIDTGNEEIEVWGAQLETSAYATSYIPTTSASATRNKTDCRLTNTDGDTYYKSVAGELQVVAAFDVDDSAAQRTLLRVRGGSANDDTNFYVRADEKVQHEVRDSSGTMRINTVSTAAIADATVEFTARGRFDSVNDIPGGTANGDLILDGSKTSGADVTWATGTDATTMYVGQNHAAGLQIGGLIATVGIWAGPRADVP